MLRRALNNWLSRHRNRLNFWLHMLGIPAAFVAAPVALLLGRGVLAGILFAGGYALQFLGHALEHNQSGEEMLLRRLLGRSTGRSD